MRTVRYLMLLLLLCVIAGCRDHQETLPPEISQILGLDRPLEVLMVSPTGETSAPSDFEAVTVVFNQPMKSLGASFSSAPEPFRLEPSVEGSFRWKGTATVSFVPLQPLPFGTDFKVIVPAGIAASSGKTLTQEASFSFSTPGPSVVRSFPENGSKSYSPARPIVLGFDQPVDPAKVAERLAFTDPGLAKPTVRALTEAELSVLHKDLAPDAEPLYLAERSVAVEPPALQPGVTHSLKLDKGLLGQSGPKPSTKEFVLGFTTLAPLTWKGRKEYKDADPEAGIALAFSNEVDHKALKQHLSLSPEVEIPSSRYDEGLELSEPVVEVTLQPNTSYTVTIDKELTDVHGQKLGQDVVFSWSTGDRHPSVMMAEGIGVLEANGKLSIPMGLLNIDEQTVKMARLSNEEMLSLAGRDTYEWLYGERPWQPSQGFSLTQTVRPDGPRNQFHDTPLDLGPLMKGQKFGFVYYEVESKGARDFITTHRGLVQITNLGATAKFSADNSLFMATALDTAKPLAGVEATVADGSGRPLWKGTTGEDGRLEAPGWSQLLGNFRGEAYDTPPMTLVLRQGEDRVFVRNGAFGSVWASNFDITTRYDNSAHQLRGQAYTERGLYRPGEQVQLKGAVRDRAQGKWTAAGVKQVEFELFNSRDESMEKGQLAVSEFGTFHHTLTVPDGSPTGFYRISYSLPEPQAKEWRVDRFLTGAAFRVEEFEPADFEVTVSSSQAALSAGQTLDFEVLGSWLFGSPMNAEKLTWSSYLEPDSYSHDDFPGFDFGPLPLDNDEAADTHQKLSSGSGVTDNQGRFKAQLPLKGVSLRGDGRLVVEATVTSTNRRSVTGRLLVPVARGEYRLGLRANSRFVSGGQPATVQAVALGLDGKPVAGKVMKLELLRREWNSVRKVGAAGRFEWVTEIEDQTVDRKELRSGEAAMEVTFAPKSSGYYVVRATSDDGAGNSVLSETGFYAEGSDPVPWARYEDERVELVADKPRYEPGETAKILIKSPFAEATALVSYERDAILHSYTTKLTGSSPTIEVPLTEEHLPNLYVSVMLLRGRVAGEPERPQEDTGKPAFKMGYIDLPVSSESQRLKVEVTTDRDKYGPGEQVVTKLKVTDSQGKPVAAELSLTAADVGALSLVDYQTPDFYDTFHGSLPLSVRTSESRTDVIGQRSYGAKGETPGGGGGYNPGFRSDFRLTAVWEPRVLTDANGEAEVRFNLPENLSTFRVMATAIDKATRCGKAETKLVIAKPLMLKASAPSFARLGDELQAGVLAVNGTDTGRSLKLSLEADGIDGEFGTREIFLNAGEEREVLFSMKPSKEGMATLRFSGELGEHRDGLVVEMPLRQATQKVHLASTGQTTEASHKETVAVPASAREGSAQLKVWLSPTLLTSLQTSVGELATYPHGCLEQRLSQFEPMLLADDLAARFGLSGWNKEKTRASVQGGLNLLSSYSAANGGLKTWPDATEANPYLTALALRTVHLAKERGYKVNDAWIGKAKSYLRGYLDRTDNGLLDFSEAETLVTKAAALDALSRHGLSGRSYLNVLMDRRDKMPLLGKAYLLQAAHRLGAKDSVKLLSAELTNALKSENATAHFPAGEAAPWLYSSDVRVTGLVLAALYASGEKLPVGDKVARYLLEARNSEGSWGSTAANSAAISGLWEYAQVAEGAATPKFSVSVTAAGASLGPAVEFGPEKLTAGSLEGALRPGETPVELQKSGEGRLYYEVAVSYQEAEPQPAVDEGLTVVRQLMDLEGRPVTELVGGEIYKVGLSVIAPAQRRFVVLEDPVPAGLVVVKDDFATESRQLRELLKRGSQPSWKTFLRFESYAERVLLFADALAPGEHYYEYLVRAQAPGRYLHPAAQVEEMYHPELFGRTAAGSITIK